MVEGLMEILVRRRHLAKPGNLASRGLINVPGPAKSAAGAVDKR
jgi:hypothetical protein